MDKQDIKKEGGQPNNTNACKWTEDAALEIANQLIKWMSDLTEDGQPTSNIFFKQFLVEKDLYDSEITYLCEKYQSFSHIIKKAKELQELKLMGFGIANKLNPAITIFVLKNKHKWVDKTENEVNFKNSTPTIELTKDQIDKALEQY